MDNRMPPQYGQGLIRMLIPGQPKAAEGFEQL